jgi:RpiR family carbohydrate utilization transcriptional regulator
MEPSLEGSMRSSVAQEPMELRARLRDRYPELSPAQRRLAAFLLENLPTASDYTITELAEAAGVSIGTISQLCRRLGLKGYQDLRLSLAREAVVLDATEASGHRLALPAGPEDVVRAVERVFGRDLEALTATAAGLDPAALQASVDAIVGARRVEVVGVATAALVAQEAALKLRKLGIDAVAHPDAHVQAMSAALLGAGDVLIAVSHSGRTLDTVRAARLARGGGAIVVALCGEGRSPLAATADVRLTTIASDTGFQVEPIASTIAALAIVQTLFLLLLERGGAGAEDHLSRTQAAVEERHITGRTW